jgi:hypothetical protein
LVIILIKQKSCLCGQEREDVQKVQALCVLGVMFSANLFAMQRNYLGVAHATAGYGSGRACERMSDEVVVTCLECLCATAGCLYVCAQTDCCGECAERAGQFFGFIPMPKKGVTMPSCELPTGVSSNPDAPSLASMCAGEMKKNSKLH